jgi:sulfhydrogenase subunit beta (sulfur reductase)
MSNGEPLVGPFLLTREQFPDFFAALSSEYEIYGPTVSDEAIVYDRLTSTDQLPIGWTDEQSPGEYRLHRREDQALFGYVVGPRSWKQYLHPPRVRLFSVQRSPDGMTLESDQEDSTKRAFLGVRPCEVAAIRIQDQVFLGGEFVDPVYAGLRKNTILVAVNCNEPGGTCFCASVKTGPRARESCDLMLTEILDEDRHVFLVEVGSEEGVEIISSLGLPAASPDLQEAGMALSAQATDQMKQALDTSDLKELLYESLEHPRWQEVGERCLACGNCTMVCPTCFCTSVNDTTDLKGETAERWKIWDSCFTTDFSYIHGGSVRNSTESKYRQWLTHKLASWQDQFNTLGCVGCGRCITWCPVGINITEEVEAIRASRVETSMS